MKTDTYPLRQSVVRMRTTKRKEEILAAWLDVAQLKARAGTGHC